MSYVLNKCKVCLEYIEVFLPNQTKTDTICWRCRQIPDSWHYETPNYKEQLNAPFEHAKTTQEDNPTRVNLQEFYYIEDQTCTIYKIFQHTYPTRTYTSAKVLSCGYDGATELDSESLLIQVSKAIDFYLNPESYEKAPFFPTYDLALTELKERLLTIRDQEIEAIRVKYSKLLNFGEDS
jgi:hypothetical protein